MRDDVNCITSMVSPFNNQLQDQNRIIFGKLKLERTVDNGDTLCKYGVMIAHCFVNMHVI